MNGRKDMQAPYIRAKSGADVQKESHHLTVDLICVACFARRRVMVCLWVRNMGGKESNAEVHMPNSVLLTRVW